MADYVARSSQSSVANGGVAIPSTNLRQELVTQDNVLQWVREGRVYGINVGTVTTPATFSAAALALTTPEVAILVPTGIFIVPLQVCIRWEATVGTLIEAAIGMSQNSIGNGTSSAGTSVSLKDGTADGGTTQRITYTAAGTALTNGLELWRTGYWTDLDVAANPVPPGEWGYKTHVVPILTGPATFMVATGVGTSASGFITLIYARFTVGDW